MLTSVFRAARLAVLAAALVACSPVQAELPVQGFEVQAAYPHDTAAFTEGLFYLDGVMFESTGLEGASSIRQVRLADGIILQSRATDPRMFGEGIVNWDGDLISLTWRNGVGFRWDLKTFAPKGSFRYDGEGWALTQDGKSIIMSDGTPTLRFLDPKTLKVTHTVAVTADGRPLGNLNEIEWVKGEILANVWMTNRIARINPKTGAVKGWIDMTGLPETLSRRDPDAVLNGIAYDKTGDRLFVTGKRWPQIYEITLKPTKSPAP